MFVIHKPNEQLIKLRTIKASLSKRLIKLILYNPHIRTDI